MSKKTFSLTAWLLILCGGLIISLLVLSKRSILPWQRPPVPPPVLTLNNINKYEVGNIAFTPDGRELIHEGAIIEQWDVATGKPVSVPTSLKLALPTRRARRARWCVGLSSNGKIAAIQNMGTYSRTVQQAVSTPLVNANGTIGNTRRKTTYARHLYRNKHIDLIDMQTGW